MSFEGPRHRRAADAPRAQGSSRAQEGNGPGVPRYLRGPSQEPAAPDNRPSPPTPQPTNPSTPPAAPAGRAGGAAPAQGAAGTGPGRSGDGARPTGGRSAQSAAQPGDRGRSQDAGQGAPGPGGNAEGAPSQDGQGGGAGAQANPGGGAAAPPAGAPVSGGAAPPPSEADAPAADAAPAGGSRGPEIADRPPPEPEGFVPARPARLGGTEPPPVPEPPKMAPRQIAKIRRQTGISPDEHHDRIRQQMTRIALNAGRAQREVVHRVEWIGARLRRDIQAMTRDIDRVCFTTLARLEAAASVARAEMERVARTERAAIEAHNLANAAQIEAGRTAAVSRMATSVRNGSTEIQAAYQLLSSSYTAAAQDTKRRLVTIATEGTLSGPTGRNPPAGYRAPPAPPGAGKAATPAPIGKVSDKGTEVTTRLGTEAANYRPSSAQSLNAYKAFRTSPLVGPRVTEKQTALTQGANSRGDALLGPGVHDRNLLSFLQLMDEGARGIADQTERNRQNAASEIVDEQGQLAAAKRIALGTVDETLRRALAQLTEQHRRMREAAIKAAEKAKEAMRIQADASDNAIRGIAPDFADQHRANVRQLRLLVPPGRMHDQRQLAPKLRVLERSVFKQRHDQIELVSTQAKEADKRARESLESQLKGLREMADSGAEAFQGLKTGAVFSIQLEREAFTGQMSDGSAGTIRDAIAHGERVVRGNEGQPQTVAVAVYSYMARSAFPSFDALVSAFADSTRDAVKATPNELGMGTPEGVVEFSPPGPTGTLLHSVSEAANSEIRGAANALNGAMPADRWRINAAFDRWGWTSTQSAVTSAISGVPGKGRPALEWEYEHTLHRGNLRSRIRDRLSGNERQLALDLLNEDNVSAANRALRSQAGWWGVNAQARDAVLSSLNDTERASLTNSDSAQWQETLRQMQSGLSAQELSTVQRYAAVGPAAIIAADFDRRLAEARRQGDAATTALIAQLEADARASVGGQYYASLVPQSQVDALMNNIYREHARLHTENPDRQPRLGDQEARERFITYATRTYTEWETRGYGEHQETVEVTRQLTAESQRLVRLTLEQGARSNEVWALQTATTLRNAERDGANNNNTVAVTRAVQNQGLDRALAMLEESRGNPALGPAMRERQAAQDALNRLPLDATPEQRKAAETRVENAQRNPTLREHERRLESVRTMQAAHDVRMRALATNLLPPGQTLGSNRNAGTEFMAQRLGAFFRTYNRDSQRNADGHIGQEYGESLARRGRGTAFSGIMLATMGSGTNEDLLRSSYENRRQSQIRGLNEEYARRVVGDPTQTQALNNMLGFGPNPTSLPELSGDDLQQIRLMAMGEPETDRDHVMIALQRINDQLYLGTGPAGRVAMRGTAQQTTLLEERARLLDMLQESASTNGGRVEPAVDANGRLNPLLLDRAFNDGGRLRGEGNEYQQSLRSGRLVERAQMVQLASDDYRTELDRQEQGVLHVITIIGAIIAIALLFVLNPVAAAVVGALIAGALTMGAKAMMRGGRYGWEEMATDAGQMLMEAAVGAVGGGFAMRAAKAGAPAARAAAMATRATNAASRGGQVAAATGRAALAAEATKKAAEASGVSMFARVMMNPVGRGAVTQGISGMGSTAMQDRTWDDGFWRGMGRVGLAGARGAVVGALTEGISTSLGGGMQHALDPTFARRAGAGAIAGQVESAAAKPMGAVQRFASSAGARLGPAGREAISQGISDAIGGVIGQGAGIVIDMAAGTHQGGWQAAGLHLLQTAGREFLTSGARGAVTSRNRSRLNDFQEQLLQRNRPPTDAELSTLARYARVAGQSHTLEDFRTDLGLARVERAQLVAGLPPGARARWAELPLDSLRQVHDLVRGGDASPESLAAIVSHARRFGSTLDAEELGTQIGAARDEARTLHAQSRQAHRDLLSGDVPNFVRQGMRDVDLSGLRGLPPEAQALLRERMASNTPLSDADHAQILNLVRSVRPDADADAIGQGLRNLDAASQAAHTARTAQLAAGRERFMADVPEDQRAGLSGLPEGALNRMAELAARGQAGTPADHDALRRMAGSPELGEAAINALSAAATATRQRDTDAREARRQTRLETLADLPEEVRGPLSQLPPRALEVARQLIEAGSTPSPQQVQWLLRQARAETPGGGGELLSALQRATQHAQTMREPENRLRADLLAALPPDAQTRLGRTRVTTLPPDAFDAMARTPGAQVLVDATTRPARVFVRDGADALALMQAGARLAEHRGRYGAAAPQSFEGLSGAERLAVHRATVDLEVAAQRRVVEALRAQVGDLDAPRAREMLARAEAGLIHLEARQARLSQIGRGQRLAMALGIDNLGISTPPVLVGMAGGSGRAVPPSVLRWMLGQLSGASPAEALARAAEAELRAAAHAHLKANEQDLSTNRGFWEQAYEARVIAAAGHTPPEVAARRHSVAASLLRGDHPRMLALRAGDPAAIEGLLRQHGNWQELMGVLALAGRGSPAWEIGRQVYAFREGVISGLDRRFGARPVDSASTELISDVDLNIGTTTEHARAPGAGRRLIAAESEMARRFGPNWSEMLRMNFYTDATRLTRYEDVMVLMRPQEAQALMARNAQASEVYDYAAMLMFAQHGGPQRAQAVREQIARTVDPETLSRIEALARMPEPERIARRNELLLQQDRLQRQFYELVESLGIRRWGQASVGDQLARLNEVRVLDPAIRRQLVALAEQISLRQSEANFFSVEAYISGGAGRMVVSGQRVQGPEAWSAARSQLAMIEHIIGMNHGDVGAAGRQYETFKYIERFVQAARLAGINDARLDAFARLATLVNRLDRGIFSSDEAGFTAGRARGPHADVPADVVANPSRLARWYAQEDPVFHSLPAADQARAIAAIEARLNTPGARRGPDLTIERIADRVLGRVNAPHYSSKVPEQNRVYVTDPTRPGTRGTSDALTSAMIHRFLDVAHGVLGQMRGGAGLETPTPRPVPDTVQRQAHLENAMGDLKGRVPVVQDNTLPGATVLVRYQNGKLRVVAGPDASSGDIAAHLETARALLPYEGPIGRIRRLGSRIAELITQEPGYGSRGFEARLEQRKLTAILRNLRAEEQSIATSIAAEQGNADLAGRQSRVQRRIAEIEAQLQVHEADLHSLSRGQGFVAAFTSKTQASLGTDLDQIHTSLGHFYAGYAPILHNLTKLVDAGRIDGLDTWAAAAAMVARTGSHEQLRQQMQLLAPLWKELTSGDYNTVVRMTPDGSGGYTFTTSTQTHPHDAVLAPIRAGLANDKERFAFDSIVSRWTAENIPVAKQLNLIARMLPEVQRTATSMDAKYDRLIQHLANMGRPLVNPDLPEGPNPAHTDITIRTVDWTNTTMKAHELAQTRALMLTSGEPVVIFLKNALNQDYPGFDGIIGNPPRPLSLKRSGPAFTDGSYGRRHAQEAFTKADSVQQSGVEVHILLEGVTPARLQADWNRMPNGEPLFNPFDRGVLSKVVITCDDGTRVQVRWDAANNTFTFTTL